MPRNKQFPPTTHYKIYDYETDMKDLEKAKADFRDEKRHPAEKMPKEERFMTETEAEELRSRDRHRRRR